MYMSIRRPVLNSVDGDVLIFSEMHSVNCKTQITYMYTYMYTNILFYFTTSFKVINTGLPQNVINRFPQ